MHGTSDQKPTEKPLLTDTPSKADSETERELIIEPKKTGKMLITEPIKSDSAILKGNDPSEVEKRELLKR